MASRVVYRGGSAMVKQHFAQAAQMTQMAGAPVNVRRLRVGDFAALEFKEFPMTAFQVVLKVFAIVIAIVFGLHVATGTNSEILLGAHWPQGAVLDATIDSQDRF